MQEIAEAARYAPDAKVRRFLDWLRENLCPDLPPYGMAPKGGAPRWNLRRVLIFPENREGTKRYLKTILEQAIAGTDRADERIALIDGLTRGADRKDFQCRFNTDPARTLSAFCWRPTPPARGSTSRPTARTSSTSTFPGTPAAVRSRRSADRC
jgi:hypothetical protein